MKIGKDMCHIYKEGDVEFSIEVTQSQTREEVIKQYIQRRKEKGLTQEELAKRAGIPRTNITRFESLNYNPSLEMMVRIAAALDMKLKIQLENEM